MFCDKIVVWGFLIFIRDNFIAHAKSHIRLGSGNPEDVYGVIPRTNIAWSRLLLEKGLIQCVKRLS